MKDGLELQAPTSASINRAVTYAICVLSTAFAAWMVLHALAALRWW